MTTSALRIVGFCLLAATAFAEVHVTSVRAAGDQSGTFADQPLAPTVLALPGDLVLPDGAAGMMLAEEAKAAIIVLGPADVRLVESDDRTELSVVLRAGRVLVAVGGGGSQRLRFIADPVDVQAVGPGQFMAERTADASTIAHTSDSGQALGVRVRGAASALASGQRLSVDARGVQTSDAAEWVAASGLSAALADSLAISAGTRQRSQADEALFSNVVSWDRRAGASYVKARVDSKFVFEIRQVATAVTTPQSTNVSTSGVQVAGVAGANEVPGLSPASLVVQNLLGADAGAVTVIALNGRAGASLSLTNSQGLGFAGLANLALPGFLNNVVRNIGPAGLGGVRR